MTIVPQSSNPLLVLLKQKYDQKPVATKRKSQFFVIFSDSPYKEKLQAKINKEKKTADIEERTKAYQKRE